MLFRSRHTLDPPLRQLRLSPPVVPRLSVVGRAEAQVVLANRVSLTSLGTSRRSCIGRGRWGSLLFLETSSDQARALAAAVVSRCRGLDFVALSEVYDLQSVLVSSSMACTFFFGCGPELYALRNCHVPHPHSPNTVRGSARPLHGFPLPALSP